MKKSLCILLTIVLIALSIPAVGADTAQDKISPELRALLAQHPETGIENGVVVEIFHHNPNYPTDGISEELAELIQDNPKHPITDAERQAYENNLKAQAELIGKIGEITHMEPDGFSLGRFYIGLPYESIEKVAELENLDYIDLPQDKYSSLPADEKYSDSMLTALSAHNPDDVVCLRITLAYTPHPYVGVPEPYDGCTAEEYNAYFYASQEANKAHYRAKNEEYSEAIAANAEVDNIRISESSTIVFVDAKLREAAKIAPLKEVAQISFMHVVKWADDEPLVYADRFEQWIFDTRGCKKFDPELSKSDPYYDFWNNYDNYDELYLTDSWALVYATVNMYDPWEVVDHIRIGDRILSWYAPGAAVYPFGYFVYNAAEDTFYPIDRFVYPVEGYAHTDDGEFIKDENGRYVKEIVEPVISLDDYPGLVEALDELRIGRAVGDADGDGERTVLDATRVQRVKAGLEEADETDLYMIGVGISGTAVQSDDITWLSWSDADGDGIVTVMDATRIQRTVADLCDIDGVAKD